MKLLVQETLNAYGPTDDIPDDAWITVSDHRKVDTARLAKDTLEREMRQRCGHSAWDSHRRILNAGTLAIGLHVEWYCTGWKGAEHHQCDHFEVVRYMWQPGEAEPSPPLPTGWSGSQCPDCRRAEGTYQAREIERWQAEEAGVDPRLAQQIKTVIVTVGPPDDTQVREVQLNGVLAIERLTPKLARQALRVAQGHDRSGRVLDEDYHHGYDVYPRSARKFTVAY